VVEVAFDGRTIAARRPAGQIARPQEGRQFGRRSVSGFGAGWRQQRPQLGGLRQFGYCLRRDQSVGSEHGSWCRTAALEGDLFGHHVNDHRIGGTLTGAAAAGATPTAESVGPRGQCTERVGAPLITCSRIGRTYRGGQCIQPLIPRFGVGGKALAVHLAHPRVDSQIDTSRSFIC
jgi:hypothetical protein